VPIMIDSSKWEIIERAWSWYKGKCGKFYFVERREKLLLHMLNW
jgi:cobalamin-dependent methionine synthase I